jgi:hypothetical protein
LQNYQAESTYETAIRACEWLLSIDTIGEKQKKLQTLRYDKRRKRR